MDYAGAVSDSEVELRYFIQPAHQFSIERVHRKIHWRASWSVQLV